ncbi:MAG: cell division protein FtsL [Tissierellia bacterium]|nr:cell division protein FtsL [Tissierellia bacterium]
MALPVKERQIHVKKNLRVVNDKSNFAEMNRRIKKARRKRSLILSSVLAIMSIMAFMLIMRYIKVTNLNSELTGLNKSIESLRTERDYLVTELEPYKATQRIETYAKINLGMDYPKPSQYVKIESGFKNNQIAQVETESIGAFKSFFSALFGVFDKE